MGIETILIWGIGLLIAILILLWLKKKFFAILWFIIFIGAGPEVLSRAESFFSSIDSDSIIGWFDTFLKWLG